MTVTPATEAASTDTGEPAGSRQSQFRHRAALALGVVAVALAVVGALGPATKDRATYSWPPRSLPPAEPTSEWYAPLLLTRHVPERLEAAIPCLGTRPLPAARSPLTLLSTTRAPAAGGLHVTTSERGVSFALSGVEFADVAPATADETEPCTVRLIVEEDRWSLAGPGTDLERGDFGGARPVIYGFFSGVDLRRGPRPSVVVTTEPFAASPTPTQNLAWILATLSALAALGLVAAPRRARGGLRSLGNTGGAGVRSLRPVDAFVVLLLLTWWIVGPVLFDDGWVKVRQTNYGAADGFSNYYTTLGANLALDFWLEWLQHWVVAAFDALVVLRLPALALLGATWLVCRWVLTRMLAGSSRSVAAEWALGIAFTLNALAWLMTLRPEPVLALLLVGVFAAAVRFTEQPGALPLAVAAVLVALALSAHPAGLVSVAPLVVIAPQIVSWVRPARRLELAIIGLAALALLLVLVTVGSDLSQRLEEARVARTVGDAVAGWREELTRYQFRGAEATTLRRASVALMIVALLAYLLRERASRSALDLPGASLGVALIFLIPTPSKWAWHFGALAALAALAVAVEVARLRRSASPVRPLLALAAVALVIGWSWSPRVNWSSGLDLRTYDWTLTIEDRVPLVRLMAALPVVVLVGWALVVLVRNGRSHVRRVPESLVGWLVPLAILPLVAFNLAVLIRDAAETPVWSLPRQNLSGLVGDVGCGLGDDTAVALPGSMEPLPTIGSPGDVAARTSAVPPLARLSVYAALGARTEATTPWYRLPDSGGRVGFYVSSVAAARAATVSVRWATHEGSRVVAGDWHSVGISTLVTTRSDTIRWLFVPESAFPARPDNASAVQLMVVSTESPPRVLYATGAVAYRSIPLTTLVGTSGARPLVAPNLVHYLPCARLPRLARGVVEPPTVVVFHYDAWLVEHASSPFLGILDVFQLRDLSVGDSSLPPQGVQVVWVDTASSGSVFAPPEIET